MDFDNFLDFFLDKDAEDRKIADAISNVDEMSSSNVKKQSEQSEWSISLNKVDINSEYIPLKKKNSQSTPKEPADTALNNADDSVSTKEDNSDSLDEVQSTNNQNEVPNVTVKPKMTPTTQLESKKWFSAKYDVEKLKSIVETIDVANTHLESNEDAPSASGYIPRHKQANHTVVAGDSNYFPKLGENVTQSLTIKSYQTQQNKSSTTEKNLNGFTPKSSVSKDSTDSLNTSVTENPQISNYNASSGFKPSSFSKNVAQVTSPAPSKESTTAPVSGFKPRSYRNAAPKTK